MRQLTAGLAVMALAVTGCAATATSSGGSGTSKTPQAATSHSASAASPATGLSGLPSSGPGLAQWVVHGTFETDGSPAQPLSGMITFRDSTTGQTATVTVGASGKFSLGLVAGTYTATGQTKQNVSPCSAPVTVTVRAGQLTQVSVTCKAS
jgi:hypothetical protein